MFFIAYVLCSLRLLELRTEGQTKTQKSLPKKNWNQHSRFIILGKRKHRECSSCDNFRI